MRVRKTVGVHCVSAAGAPALARGEGAYFARLRHPVDARFAGAAVDRGAGRPGYVCLDGRAAGADDAAARGGARRRRAA